jgi:hypothetical protein
VQNFRSAIADISKFYKRIMSTTTFNWKKTGGLDKSGFDDCKRESVVVLVDTPHEFTFVDEPSDLHENHPLVSAIPFLSTSEKRATQVADMHSFRLDEATGRVIYTHRRKTLHTENPVEQYACEHAKLIAVDEKRVDQNNHNLLYTISVFYLEIKHADGLLPKAFLVGCHGDKEHFTARQDVALKACAMINATYHHGYDQKMRDDDEEY